MLSETYGNARNDAEYQDDDLGRQLALVARLLKGGLRTRLFVVELDGFDTHAKQAEEHAVRLQSVAANVASFFTDLATDGTDRRVLAMTFSEFGRRVEQNGSRGTDHGAAAPMVLFGPALESNATIGTPPDLSDTDDHGNLRAAIDYRSVYATVLSRWLCLDDGLTDKILGKSFTRLEALGLSCQNTTSVANAAEPGAGIQLRAYRDGSGIVIHYNLDGAAAVSIHLYDAVGRKLATGFRGHGQDGPNQQRLDGHLPHGVYIVSLEIGSRVHSVRLPIF